MIVVVGKLNISPDLFSYHREDENGYARLTALFGEPIRQVYSTTWGEKESNWAIIDNVVLDQPAGPVVVGRLARIREAEFPAFDREAFKQVKTRIPNACAHANFVLDIHSELIAFEEKDGLSLQNFVSSFSALSMMADPTLGHVSIYPRIDVLSFERAVGELRVISEMKLDFVRPNPIETDGILKEFRQKLLVDPNSSHTTIDLEAEGNGLDKDSLIVQAGKKIADQGYGSASFHGRTEGNVDVEVDSDSNRIRQSVTATDEVTDVFEKFIRVIENIIRAG